MTAPAPADPVLDELLDRELAFDAVAHGGFSNHLAMGLVASRRIGATDQDLHRWYDGQVDYPDYLARRPRPDWLDPDTAMIATEGIEAWVHRRLPAVVDAPFTQFFHAVIRLELAIDARHPGQVASAVHNWEDHARPLAVPAEVMGSLGGDDPLAAVVSGLWAHPAAARGRVADVSRLAAQPWFAEAVTQLRVHDGLLDEVAALALAAYRTQLDFGTLHMVTGTRAMRAVARFLDDGDRVRLAAHAAVAIAACAVAMVDPSTPLDGTDDAPEAPEWPDIGQAAVATDDPHVAKLVYAAQLEERATGNGWYRHVAARQAGLIQGTG